MAGPPPLPGADAPENPLDRAIALHLAGDNEGALRWAAALVQSEPGGPAASFVAARVLGTLGATKVAVEALEGCVTRSIDSGNFALAVAACRQLEAFGGDATPRLQAVATVFAKGSRRLQEQGAAPPKMPGQHDGFAPLSDSVGGAALLDQAKIILQKGREALDREVDSRGAPPALRPLPLFSALSTSGLRAMAGALHVELVGANHRVVQEGQEGDSAYVVARGELEVSRDGDDGPVRLARLGNGTLFGEMALLSRSPRNASVTACRPSIILTATKSELDQIAEKNPEIGAELAAFCQRRMVETLVRSSPLLRAVRHRERFALMQRFGTRVYEPGATLIQQGERTDGLHLIASGSVRVVHKDSDGGTAITSLGPGESVGEVAVVLRRVANADVVAEFPTVTLMLPDGEFLAAAKQYPEFLSELYLIAVKRDEETATIAAQDATEVDDAILV